MVEYNKVLDGRGRLTCWDAKEIVNKSMCHVKMDILKPWKSSRGNFASNKSLATHRKEIKVAANS